MIRPLTSGDLVAADAVLQASFGVSRSFAPRVARYLAIQPDGWLAYEEDAAVIGTVGGIDHDGVVYVGLMGVLPEAQGRGIGRRLLERLLAWADARGARCAALDATESGARLYERIGFVDSGSTHELIAPSLPAPPPSSPRSDLAVTAAAGSDEADIRALDAALFGARRDRMWERLFAECTGRLLIARGRSAQLDGYLCVLPEALGPWGARDRATAAVLLGAAARIDAAARVLVPGENTDALALLADAGFTIARTLRHMRRGTPPRPLDWRALYGKASYCLG